MANIAFIGLGHMGLPMARNLLEAGHEVTGFDVSEAQMAAFAESGGRTARSLEEAPRSMSRPRARSRPRPRRPGS